jgi:hypothetical protein
MMKPKKLKANEPSPRDKLSQNFMRALEADFEAHGIAAIEKLRERSPEKYCEISARLIAAIEPKADDEPKTLQDIGRGLLKAVGCDEDAMSDAAVEQAIEANDVLRATLENIKNKAEGQTH